MLGRLPPETLIAIFGLLDPGEQLDLRLCSRWLNELILQHYPFAQYRVDCCAAGVIDDREDGPPYAERTALLRERERRWCRGEWVKEVEEIVD